jgi:hypothetical protein
VSRCMGFMCVDFSSEQVPDGVRGQPALCGHSRYPDRIPEIPGSVRPLSMVYSGRFERFIPRRRQAATTVRRLTGLRLPSQEAE